MNNESCGIFRKDDRFQCNFFSLNCCCSSSERGLDEFAISACPFKSEVIPNPDPPPEMAMLKVGSCSVNFSARLTARLTSVSEPFIFIELLLLLQEIDSNVTTSPMYGNNFNSLCFIFTKMKNTY